MNQKLSKVATIFLASIIGISSFFAAPATFAKDGDPCASNVPAAVREAAGCNNNQDALGGLIINILNGVIAFSGLIAVVFVIIGGINYMTSGGDTGKVEKGKKTILYALIGLAVCILAFAIVNFVIRNIILNGDTDKTSSFYTQLVS